MSEAKTALVVEGGAMRGMFSAGVLLGSKHVLDLDWLWDELARIEPLDVPAILASGTSLMSTLASFTVASPGLARAHRNAAERYRQAVQFVLEPPRDCQIVHVAPEVPLPVSRMTQDAQALERTYALGREHGLRAIETWQALPSS